MVMLPLNQLLRSIPPKIVPSPIQIKVNEPCTKSPTITLFVTISEMLAPFVIAPSGILDIPLDIPTKIIMIPAKVENILMNVEGVVLFSDPIALSISKALITNATPNMLRYYCQGFSSKTKDCSKPTSDKQGAGYAQKEL